MVEKHITYTVQCDRCKIDSGEQIGNWIAPNDKIYAHYTKMHSYSNKEELLTKLISMGWNISEQECICPKCIYNENFSINIGKINGLNVLDIISTDEDIKSEYRLKYIFKEQIEEEKCVRISFLLDDGDMIYKHNTIYIYENKVHVSLCERYEGSDLEISIEQKLTEKLASAKTTRSTI